MVVNAGSSRRAPTRRLSQAPGRRPTRRTSRGALLQIRARSLFAGLLRRVRSVLFLDDNRHPVRLPMLFRNRFLSSLIGEPWAWQSSNCWDFACHVERELFGRDLPHVAVPAEVSKRWILEAIDRHPERTAWRAVADGPGGLVTASDGALVLMAHLRFPAHIGVWLAPEARHPLQRTAWCVL
jgi:hypothetical protein